AQGRREGIRGRGVRAPRRRGKRRRRVTVRISRHQAQPIMYVSTRLGRWYYEERGKARDDGDAIVLWPSFLCDGGMWDAQVAPLAGVSRVIVFDGPGHGKSEVPPPFSLDDNARALLDALDALGVKRFAMAGLSWGGMVGMRVAVLAPERVA